MAFDNENLALVGAGKGEMPAIYSYVTDDSIDTVTSSGYFNEKVLQFESGDMINVSSAQGCSVLTISVSGSTVTTSASIDVTAASKYAEAYLTTLETVTISSAGAWYTVGGGNFQSDFASYFTVSTDGELTYTHPKSNIFKISFSATLDRVGAGVDEINAAIAVNSTIYTKTAGRTSELYRQTVCGHGIFTLNQNDVLEIGVSNTDGTNNVQVYEATIIAESL